MWKRIWYKCLWQIIDSEFQLLKVKQVEKTICGQIIVEWKWKLQYVKQFWNIIQVRLRITNLRLIDVYHYQITYYQIVVLCRYTFDNYISKNLSTLIFDEKLSRRFAYLFIKTADRQIKFLDYMIRNFKRPMEPLIGTAGRVWKIGFSTRVPEKRTVPRGRGWQ